jgi:hypothetical protein
LPSSSSDQRCGVNFFVLNPDRTEHRFDGRVSVSVNTETGERLQFVMTSAAFVAATQLAMQCMQDNLAQLLVDIGVM